MSIKKDNSKCPFRALLKFDYSVLFNRSEHAHWFYEASRFCDLQCWSAASTLVSSLGALFTGADISPKAKIDRSVKFISTSGVVIGPNVVIEKDCQIQNGVTLLPAWNGVDAPIIRQGAKLGSGARIIGAVEIEKDSEVKAQSVIEKQSAEFSNDNVVSEEKALEDFIKEELLPQIAPIESEKKEEENNLKELKEEKLIQKEELDTKKHTRKSRRNPDSIPSIEIPQLVEPFHKRRGRPKKHI